MPLFRQQPEMNMNIAANFTDYKVSAKSAAEFDQLAQWGRREIDIAEGVMPALMALRRPGVCCPGICGAAPSKRAFRLRQCRFHGGPTGPVDQTQPRFLR